MYEGGIADFVTYLNPKGPAHQHVIWFESEDTERGISAEVAMQWSNVYPSRCTRSRTRSARPRVERTKRASERHSQRW